MGDKNRKTGGTDSPGKKTIRIRVPQIPISRTGPGNQKPVHTPGTTAPPGQGLKDQTASPVTRVQVPRLFQKTPDVVPPQDISEMLSGERESLDLNISTKILKSFSLGKKTGFTAYDVEKHGPMIKAALPASYELVREYWVIPGMALVYIALNKKSRLKEYLLYEPSLTPFEYELLERLHEDLRDVLILNDEEIGGDPKLLLFSKVIDLIRYYGVSVSDEALFKIEYYLSRNYLGWGRINALMLDPLIEDISCDGDNIPIFLFHRKEQNIRTNIVFDTDSLISLAITLAQRSGKHISSASPLIDATMPEGSRLQLTFGSEVTSRGTSFTIRKFREQPFTPIDLMELHTFSTEMLVYFWMAIENNMSMLFIGGTASGKTTSLNAVSLFIPPLAKVISIEDTRELTLYHENWIASVTREAVAEGSSNVDMFMLLKAAMRQRPEYILVGEVRGHEANTLFQAMNTGHTTFSTMHAGSVDAAIHRLENEPLNVPRNMLQALNIISIQKQIQIGPDRVRRSEEIVEIAGIDPATGNIMVNTVFEYDPVGDLFTYTGRSQVLGSIASLHGWSRETLHEEMENRNNILQAIRDQDLRDYIRFTKIIQAYYIDKMYVLDHIGNLSELLA